MTILSLSMLLRFVAPAPLSPKDWRPSRVWASVQDRASYAWGRTVKFYDNMKLVYQIQTTLHTFQQDEEQPPSAGGENSEQETDERKLPQKGSTGRTAPEAGQSSNQNGETR